MQEREQDFNPYATIVCSEQPEEVWEKEEDVQLEEPGSGGAGAADLLLLGGGAGKGMAMSDVCIVVDSGFSFTHILPFYQGRALHKSVSAFVLVCRRFIFRSILSLTDWPCLLLSRLSRPRAQLVESGTVGW